VPTEVEARPFGCAREMRNVNETRTHSIKVNGEHRRVAAGTTVQGLVQELGLDPARVAVERNLEIVPRSTLGEVEVEDGDDYEIVHFVGGG
jgi:sulfur carrier protein